MKQKTKDENIFDLYFKLNKRGSKSEFTRAWAKEIGVGFNVIKNHWLQSRELPKHLSERNKDWAVKYLQNANKNTL